MNRRPDHKGRTRTLILSDIVQSGEQPEKLYREVSDLVCKRGVEKFIGIGPVMFSQRDNIQVADKSFFTTVKEFIHSPVFDTLHDEVILIKGARQFGFDRITELLVQKVHETVLEVNLNAMVDNLNYYRSFMKPETKLVCMIKADAYGAGSVEIAKTLQEHRVDYLAVAVADEGAMLRGNGITSNIMIMNPEMSACTPMFAIALEPELYSFRLRSNSRTQEFHGLSSHTTGGPTEITSTSALPIRFNCSTRPADSCRLPSTIRFCAISTTRQALSTSRSVSSTCADWDWDSTESIRETMA